MQQKVVSPVHSNISKTHPGRINSPMLINHHVMIGRRTFVSASVAPHPGGSLLDIIPRKSDFSIALIYRKPFHFLTALKKVGKSRTFPFYQHSSERVPFQ